METPKTKTLLEEQLGHHSARWLDTKYSSVLLAFISFIESVIAPIIIDPFLVAFILARRERWLWYVGISILFSVLGGIAGYYLGFFFFEFIGTKIISFYHLDTQFAEAAIKIGTNGFVFVLIGALTPIPYKLVAIASGVFQMSFVTFLFASVFGRVLRLGLVGYATYAAGPRALPLMRRHLLKIAYGFGALLIVYLLIKFL